MPSYRYRKNSSTRGLLGRLKSTVPETDGSWVETFPELDREGEDVDEVDRVGDTGSRGGLKLPRLPELPKVVGVLGSVIMGTPGAKALLWREAGRCQYQELLKSITCEQ